jgi:excisionase family DNA binding protein
MTYLTIREASQLIGRTPATIRRYIRSGRLRAEKELGKFGEEYKIRRDDLLGLGFSPSEPGAPVRTELARRAPDLPAPRGDVVPLSLYNELLMKHERLLVQYGMIRAGGQKLLEYKAEAEARGEALRKAEDRYKALRARALREISFLRKRLRQGQIQNEERNIEITLLQDKIKRLEMAAAGAASVDGFETKVVEMPHKDEAAVTISGSDSRPAAPRGAHDPWLAVYPPGDRKEDH